MTIVQCPFCKTRFEENKTDDKDTNKCVCGATQCKEGETINTKFTDWRNGWKRDKPDEKKVINKSRPSPEDAGKSFNAFQAGCELTAARYPTMEKMALVFGLGLAGETFEAIHEIQTMTDVQNSEKALKEFGDVWYYVAMLCTTFGLKLGAVIGNDSPEEWDKKVHPLGKMQIPTSVQTVGAVVEAIKKTFGHGHPVNRDKMANFLQDVALPLSRSAYLIGKTTREILETNNRKLAERYKDGFSTEASLNKKAD